MDYYRHARKEIFPYLPENCDRLLEIGCGSGCTDDFYIAQFLIIAKKVL